MIMKELITNKENVYYIAFRKEGNTNKTVQ